MNPTLSAFLSSFDWRIEVLLVLFGFGTLYTVGWTKLRRKGAKIATRWRLVSYYSGLIILGMALLWFFDVYQYYLFFIHMLQHIMIVMWAPLLLWLGSPMPISMWGLPRELRLWIGQFFQQKAQFRKILRSVTSPVVVWFAYTAAIWGWHDPNAYSTAVENDFIHDLEHLTFFATAMVLWWHLTNAAPKIHGKRNYVLRMLLIVASYFQNLTLGIGITMWSGVIFKHYTTVPRMWGIDAQTDQTMGGLIMWLLSGKMYGIILLYLIYQVISHSEQEARIADKRRQLKQQKKLTSQAQAAP